MPELVWVHLMLQREQGSLSGRVLHAVTLGERSQVQETEQRAVTMSGDRVYLTLPDSVFLELSVGSRCAQGEGLLFRGYSSRAGALCRDVAPLGRAPTCRSLSAANLCKVQVTCGLCNLLVSVFKKE